MAERITLRWHRIDRCSARQPGQHVLEIGYPPTQLIELATHVFFHADDARSAEIASQVGCVQAAPSFSPAYSRFGWRRAREATQPWVREIPRYWLDAP
jgi:hypothetical protein